MIQSMNTGTETWLRWQFFSSNHRYKVCAISCQEKLDFRLYQEPANSLHIKGQHRLLSVPTLGEQGSARLYYTFVPHSNWGGNIATVNGLDWHSFVTAIIRLQSVCHSFHSKDTIDKYVTRKKFTSLPSTGSQRAKGFIYKPYLRVQMGKGKAREIVQQVNCLWHKHEPPSSTLACVLKKLGVSTCSCNNST